MYGKYSSLVFWAWNDTITHDGIDKQLQEFYDVGIGGVIIHARAGLKIEYMSEEWLALFAYAVKSAKVIGLKVVIYDENGWPSGFAGGEVVKKNADFAMKYLEFYTKNPPSDEEIVCNYKKVGNVYELGGNDLFVCVKKNFSYVDLTDRSVTETFIKLTHERYKKICGDEFGKTIIGVFTDEPQYSSFEHFQYPYSNGINKLFYEFSGLRLQENLWRLYAEKKGEFKKIYLQFFAERFLKNYTSVVAKWCDENKLEMTGHYSAEDGIISSACGNAGVMPHYRLMQRPGIDYLGRRYPSSVLFKQLESIKNQRKKEIVLSESYGGAGWGATLQDYAKMWCYQAAFGVNQLCAHLSPYSISGVRKRDYPGFFSSVQPWWGYAKEFFRRVEALNELLSLGKEKNRIAVIHPVTVALAQENFSCEQRELSTQFRLLTENLIDCQLDFDYVEEVELYRAEIKDGRLIVGDCAYDVVLMLKASCNERLKEKLSTIKTGVVGVDLFNRREAVCRWFDDFGYKRRVCFTDGNDLSNGLIVSYKEREDGTAMVYVFNRNDDTDKTVYINGLFKSVREIAFNGEERVLPAMFSENVSFCRVKIPAGCAKTYIYNNECVPFERKLEKRIPLKIEKCELKNKNCLTIDKASYSFNGKDYSPLKDIVKVASEIYSHDGYVWVRYEFVNNANTEDMTLFTENGYESILVNGVTPKRIKEEFFSKKLLAYDLSDCLVAGRNFVILKFDIPKNVSAQTDWEFESLRNIYYLPVEVESVYIVGDFSVEAKLEWATPKYLTCDGEFVLVDKKPYAFDGVTQTGAPFYRGALDVFANVRYDGGEAWLKAEFFGAMVVVYINGNEVGVMFNGERLKITTFLKKGENDIKITLWSTNRNLLGAHHHCRGEVKMTGRNTFDGKRGFEDFVNANVKEETYTEKYAFVPFGVEEIHLIVEK